MKPRWPLLAAILALASLPVAAAPSIGISEVALKGGGTAFCIEPSEAMQVILVPPPQQPDRTAMSCVLAIEGHAEKFDARGLEFGLPSGDPVRRVSLGCVGNSIVHMEEAGRRNRLASLTLRTFGGDVYLTGGFVAKSCREFADQLEP